MNSIIKKKILLTTLLFGLLAIALPAVSHAQIGKGFQDVNQARGALGIKDLTASQFIIAIIKVGLSIMGLIATAMIIYGGYLYVTSMGDEKKAEAGKHTILYAVIGLIIIGGAAILTNVIISTFKGP